MAVSFSSIRQFLVVSMATIMKSRCFFSATILYLLPLLPIVYSPFDVSPSSMKVAINETFYIGCKHIDAVTIDWRINETLYNYRDPSFYYAKIIPMSGSLYKLKLMAVPELNNTKLGCNASILRTDLSHTSELSETATILIQEKLDSITNLFRDGGTFFWTAPFSLDLTNVEPDIVYCVDVYNITCGGRELLISDCDVTETSYTSDVIVPDGYIREYIVTPRSNVEGAVNGTSRNITELQFMLLQLLKYTFVFTDDIYSIEVNIHFLLETQQSINPVDAASYSLSLRPLDGFEEESLLLSTITERNGSSVVLTASLPYKRLWNSTVSANDCGEHSLTETSELSTHDIQNISVTSPQPGEVRVTGDFIGGSTATGLLTIVISTSKIFYHLIERGSDQLHIEGSIQGVVGGEHSISFFVVEESGLPFNRTASTPQVVCVKNGNDVNQHSIEYSLQSTSTGVCITCTFLDSSATDCLAVVHQRISQLSSSRLMNIKSHKLNRSGDTAFGCIEGVNMEDYQVGVVGGRIVISQKDSNVFLKYAIAGSVAVLFFIFCGLLAIILICKRKKLKKKILSGQKEQMPSIKVQTSESTPQGTGVEFDVSLSVDKQELHMAPPKENLSSPVTPHRANLEAGESCEATSKPLCDKVVTKKTSSTPLTDGVNYDSVDSEKFRNRQGQEYAMVVMSSSSGQTLPDDMHKTTYEYSQILHQRVVQKESISENKAKPGECPSQRVVTSPTLCTVENLLSLLRPICSKWKDLGMVMSMDDDYLDQVFTNNEGDEACLRDLLERYMDNGDFKHNWEEIVAILEKMDENTLASDIYKLHVYPYVESQPKQTEDVFKDKLQSDIFETPPSPNSKVDENNMKNFDPSSPGPGNVPIQSTPGPAPSGGTCTSIHIASLGTIEKRTMSCTDEVDNNKPSEARQLLFEEDNKGHNSTIDDSGIFSMVNNTTLDLPAGPGMSSIAEN